MDPAASLPIDPVTAVSLFFLAVGVLTYLRLLADARQQASSEHEALNLAQREDEARSDRRGRTILTTDPLR